MENTIELPHWLFVSFVSIIITIIFVSYAVLNFGVFSHSTKPFTEYQSITIGLNLLIIGSFIWIEKYKVLGFSLFFIGLILFLPSLISIIKWNKTIKKQ